MIHYYFSLYISFKHNNTNIFKGDDEDDDNDDVDNDDDDAPSMVGDLLMVVGGHKETLPLS